MNNIARRPAKPWWISAIACSGRSRYCETMIVPAIISSVAICISILSLYFSRRSWLDTYRPIISVRATTHSGGNVAVLYNLAVENSGNRPAKNVRLFVNPELLKTKLNSKKLEKPEAVLAVFGERGHIPILANGHSITAYFGCTHIDEKRADWMPDARFEIEVKYEDFEGRKFFGKMPIHISPDNGFTGYYCETKVNP